MLRSKKIDRICCIIIVCTMLLASGFTALAAAGVLQSSRSHTLSYQTHLFDQSRVHKIEISMDNWDAFIQSCTDEEYRACTVSIDGEKQGTVGIRAKGNTSLSSVAQYGNDRYSFKIEFDHYQDDKTYRGLDKLSLNNIIQDATYMKDYWCYTFMGKMGVASPLCSYTEIYVNGEYWGLYLAVEAVEEAFLERNYGEDYGDLYKPDSLSFGGGRGNGRDFDMQGFAQQQTQTDTAPQDVDNAMMPEREDADRAGKRQSENRGEFGNRAGGFGGGMGSSDVKLQYIDDDPESYANIFDNAKTKVKEKDKKRLIAALKLLSEGDVSSIDTDAVAMYMAVHNFVCNGDSYTGSMVHNYYLYEKDGVMSMIPWDYNLAFGGFDGGSNATSTVNTAIDTLVTGGSDADRPMAGWITASADNLALYHEKYQQFIDTVFESGWFETEYERVYALIAPYVQKEVKAFYTYEEFEAASDTLKSFCLKRAQSVQGQLAGSIPATATAQQGSTALVDASEMSITAMGGMNKGGGHDRTLVRDFIEKFAGDDFNAEDMPQMPDGMGAFDGQTMPMPQDDMPQMPQGMPDTMQPPDNMGGMDTMPQMPQQTGTFAPSDAMPQAGAAMQGEMTQPDELPEEQKNAAATMPEQADQPSGDAFAQPKENAGKQNEKQNTGKKPEDMQLMPVSSVQGNSAALWLTIASLVVLLAACIFAKHFKHRM